VTINTGPLHTLTYSGIKAAFANGGQCFVRKKVWHIGSRAGSAASTAASSSSASSGQQQAEYRLVVATVSDWRQPGVSRLSIAFRLSIHPGRSSLSGCLEQLLGLPAMLGIDPTAIDLELDLGILLAQERPPVAAWRKLEGICSVMRAHIFVRPSSTSSDVLFNSVGSSMTAQITPIIREDVVGGSCWLPR
jgi:hypothetical protein